MCFLCLSSFAQPLFIGSSILHTECLFFVLLSNILLQDPEVYLHRFLLMDFGMFLDFGSDERCVFRAHLVYREYSMLAVDF